MDTFFMLGKYSAAGIHEIGDKRTVQVCEMIKRMGGKVRDIYALLGEYDLVLIVELPNMKDAMKAALAIGKLTGILFSTCAAVPVDQLDRMAEDLATEIQSARMEAGE